jgi:hypothetical protein
VGTLGLAGVLVGGASTALQGRARAERDRQLSAHLTAADSAEASGRTEDALAELNAALGLARAEAGPRPKLQSIQDRRDSAARRGISERLQRLGSVEPGQAVEACRILLDQAQRDPALAELEPEIRTALDRARARRADIEVATAEAAWQRQQVESALAACERALATSAELAPSQARRVAAATTAVATAIAQRWGVILPAVHGRFRFGSTASYKAWLVPLLADGLRRKGFAPQPAASPLREIWEQNAPYRLTLELAEDQGPNYLQSVHSTTQIHGRLGVVTREGSVLWETPFSARTRVPIPGLTAFEAGHLGASQRRDRAIERRLYDDALSVLKEQFAVKVRNFPEPKAATE